MYGKELIIDLHDCKGLPCTQSYLIMFFEELCELIGMEREDLHFWDYDGEEEEYCEAPSHLKGTSAVQFIRTSNVTVHTLDDLGKVFVNIFSCKDFDPEVIISFSAKCFSGLVASRTVVERV